MNKTSNQSPLYAVGHGSKWLKQMRAVLAICLAFSLFVGPSGFADDQGNCDAPGGNGFNDETVGTLPIVAGPGVTMEEISPLGMIGFLFSIRGNTSALEALILDAYGDGYVIMDEFIEEGETRLTFFGNVSVVFDQSLVSDPAMRTEILTGRDYLEGQAAMVTPDWIHGFQLPASGRVDVSLPRLEQAGLLDSGRFGLHAMSLRGHRGQVGFSIWGGQVTMTQNH